MSDQRNAGRQELAVHPRDIRTGDYLRIGTRAGVRVRQAWNVEEQGSTYVKTDDFYYPFVIDWLSRATVERAAAARRQGEPS